MDSVCKTFTIEMMDSVILNQHIVEIMYWFLEKAGNEVLVQSIRLCYLLFFTLNVT